MSRANRRRSLRWKDSSSSEGTCALALYPKLQRARSACVSGLTGLMCAEPLCAPILTCGRISTRHARLDAAAMGS